MDYYKNDDLLSASKLIAFNVHPKNYKYFSYGKADTKSLNIGNIVDCLLTEPEEFVKKYIISNIDQSSKYYDFAKEVYNRYMFSSKADFIDNVEDSFILEIRNQISFDKRLTDKKVLEVYREHIHPIFVELTKFPITTKEVIDQATYDTCMKVVTSIQTHPFTQLEKDFQHDYQCVIKWKFNGFECKSKLDILSINHKTRTIKVRDIKTTGYGTNVFKNSMSKYRYDLQGAFYWLAVKTKYPNYKIEYVEFIVESTVYPGTPLIYRMSDDLLQKSINKVNDLTDDLMWHIDNDLWDYPREVYENNGVILVNELN